MKKSGIVKSFFVTIGSVLSVPLALLKGVGEAIKALFSGFDAAAAAKAGDAVETMGKHLSGLQVIGAKIQSLFTAIGKIFGGLGEFIGKSLVGIGDKIGALFTPETFNSTLNAINTGLLGALVLLVRNFFNKGFKIDIAGGAFDGIKQTLSEATKGFQLMQQNLKASILLKLAAAIGVMALALLVLSGIDPKALTKALAAMTGGFGILIGAMATLLKVMGPAGLVQLDVITAGMTKMALSILLLAFALKVLSGIKPGDLITANSRAYRVSASVAQPDATTLIYLTV